jgi:ParB family chromosome partitioning protein
VRTKKDSADDHRFTYAERLAVTLKLDMTAWFTPTAENYFARVSKTGILEALTEAKGDIAPAWTKAKKGELAVIAERQLAETGWLPAPLRKAA